MIPTVDNAWYNRFICGEMSATLIHANKDGVISSSVTSADFLTLTYTDN